MKRSVVLDEMLARAGDGCWERTETVGLTATGRADHVCTGGNRREAFFGPSATQQDMKTKAD